MVQADIVASNMPFSTNRIFQIDNIKLHKVLDKPVEKYGNESQVDR
jgi:hypothetical protein